MNNCLRGWIIWDISHGKLKQTPLLGLFATRTSALGMISCTHSFGANSIAYCPAEECKGHRWPKKCKAACIPTYKFGTVSVSRFLATRISWRREASAAVVSAALRRTSFKSIFLGVQGWSFKNRTCCSPHGTPRSVATWVVLRAPSKADSWDSCNTLTRSSSASVLPNLCRFEAPSSRKRRSRHLFVDESLSQSKATGSRPSCSMASAFGKWEMLRDMRCWFSPNLLCPKNQPHACFLNSGLGWRYTSILKILAF